ncbi:hypothetical protein [Actinomadura atramentaria]|uniref:hypothetical protein n=1 Tax=Actinomadura atramentaria TaxID=1990 RepID=UPI0003630D2C|nr:hypothetical protein [Actinomadura atramentaria]
MNRDSELAHVSETAAHLEHAVGVCVVQGPPGVGKRAAVREFVRRHGDRFPGGDIYVDCADYGSLGTPGTANLQAMLVDVLSALRIAPEHAPRGRSQLAACYRRQLNRLPGPVLVVLENAAEPAQVRALLPNRPGSLVLVAAVPGADLGELALDGAEFVSVGRLADEHGAEVFRRAAGRAPDALGGLVRSCDGLPLALLVLAASLRARGDAELAARAADDRRLLAALVLGGRPIVAAAFTLAYRALPADLRAAYRRLGLLPARDIGPGAAAAALAADPAAARDLLDRLADAQMLERRSNGRYAFANNLIRLHARDQAEDESAEGEPLERREAVLEAVVRHYVLHAAFADRAKRADRTRVADHGELLAGHRDPFAGPDAKERALAWLDAERHNLVPVAEAAFDAGFTRLTILLADALTSYYTDRRDLVAWIATSTLGARAARAEGDAWAEARLRSMMSRPLTDRGDLDAARAELDTARRLADETGDLVLRASVAEFEGRLLTRTDPAAALDAFARSRELNERAGERRGAALALTFAAETLRVLGDAAGVGAPGPDGGDAPGTGTGSARDLYRRAAETYGAALRDFHDLDDDRMAARTGIGLGVVRARLGDAAGAADILRTAAAALRGTHYAAQASVHLADVARATGDTAAERAHLRDALAVYTEFKHPDRDVVAERLRALGSGQPG